MFSNPSLLASPLSNFYLVLVPLLNPDFDMQAAPIVRVAVEAALPSELPRLVEGLRLLNRADPFLEVTLQDKGEYVLGAAGKHLLLAISLTECTAVGWLLSSHTGIDSGQQCGNAFYKLFG